MKKLYLLFMPCLFRGKWNNTWLIGYGNWAVRARMVFDSTNYTLTQESRQMGFEGTKQQLAT